MAYSSYSPVCPCCKSTNVRIANGVARCLDCGNEETISFYNSYNDRNRTTLEHFIALIAAKYNAVISKPEESVSLEEYDALVKELDECKANLANEANELKAALASLSESNAVKKSLQEALEEKNSAIADLEKKNEELSQRVLPEATKAVKEKAPFAYLYNRFVNAPNEIEKRKAIVPLAAIVRNAVEHTLISKVKVPHDGCNYICNDELYQLVNNKPVNEKSRRFARYKTANDALLAKNRINMFINSRYPNRTPFNGDNTPFEMDTITRYKLAGITDANDLKEATTKPNNHHFVLNNCIHAGKNGTDLRQLILKLPIEDNPLVKAIEFFKEHNLFNPINC